MSVSIARVGKQETMYGVVVCTDHYAGNFERQMTAYCTGRVGHCEVGDELVPLFMADFKLQEQDNEQDPFWDCLRYVVDDRGCARPTSIYDNGDKYNSLIIFFDTAPTKEQVEIIKQRAKAYSADERIELPSYIKKREIIAIKKVFAIEIKTVVSKYEPLSFS